ncbi:MAG TPA: GTP 3',8-cyclase MoaA [Gemmatimonadales bacterium]|nr:GTP 3',8-cyclase MoaA [Gemmatimonadales bacterium]
MSRPGTLDPRPATRDLLGRPLGSLRISVTDRCNLRCAYCMPEDHYVWLPKASLLTFEEITRLARVFVDLGASKLRLTGGEPLLRHDLPALVRMLASEARPADLAMTTNGMLLGSQVAGLKSAGLRRLTVSLDTLSPLKMERHARTTRHADILAGIAAAREAGFAGTKLNAVVIRGFNDDELVDLLEYGKRAGAEVRFIEYMDVGGATRWKMDDVVGQAEILERLARHYGEVRPAAPARDRAPAERFVLPDGTPFGIIASTTRPFCRECDRGRLTADGTFYLCLYAREGLDLRAPLRAGATDAELAGLIRDAWAARTDRGAERRLEVAERGVLVPLEGLREDPRKEMHTRGG